MTHFSVHPQAFCETDQIGNGTRVDAFATLAEGSMLGSDVVIARGATVLRAAEIGDRVRVDVGAVVGEGVHIQSDVVVGPRAILSDPTASANERANHVPGRIVIGQDARIGSNAMVFPGVHISRNARVCAGAVVTRSVPANAIVSGNPANISGYVRFANHLADAASNQSVAETSKWPELQPSVVAGVSVHRSPLHRDMRGSLVANEFSKDIPFEPKRTFLVYDVPTGQVRGEHAHRECHQFISCIHGACSLVAEDGKARKEFRLDDPTIGVHIPPMVWSSQHRHTPNAVLLVHASHGYDPDDYIHDYKAFLAQVTRYE